MDQTFVFEAIGTHWRIDTEQALTATTRSEIVSRAEHFDQTYSRFRGDSLVAELARRTGTFRFPDEAAALFGLYRRLYDCTDGAVTPLVGSALEHLGYGADYRLRRAVGTVRVPAWDDVMQVDGAVVATTEPVVLDVGAAGKGFLVDLVGSLLDAAAVTEYVIDASGDLLHRGQTTERVGLENPSDSRQVIGIANLTNQALCASATHRRSWGDQLHHIVDPLTGEPTRGVLATWVVSQTCAVADGLATALFLTEPHLLAEHFDYSYVRVLDTATVEYSNNFAGEVFR